MRQPDKDVLERIRRGSVEDSDSAETIAKELRRAAKYWQQNERELAMGGGDIPEWLKYELDLWELGEAVRQTLLQKPSWRSSQELLDVFAYIVLEKDFGKGREPFVELLVRYGAKEHAAEALKALDDSEIAGHALKALRLANIRGGEERARELLESNQPKWIKKEARKYLQRKG